MLASRSIGGPPCLPLLLSLLASVQAGCAAARRPLETVPSDGFAVYRSGRMDRQDLADLCRQGVEELVDLSGTADRRECRWREAICPSLAIRYNRRQRVETPLTRDFLQAFDRWVGEAQRQGKKIAFRCWSGWHRTGRLAAYYRMRFQNLPLADAEALMLEHGRFMWLHPQLKPQVRALADYLAGRPCSVEEKFCVREASDPGLRSREEIVFPVDACAGRAEPER